MPKKVNERKLIVEYLQLLATYTKRNNPYTSPDAIVLLRGAAKAIRQGKHIPGNKEST